MMSALAGTGGSSDAEGGAAAGVALSGSGAADPDGIVRHAPAGSCTESGGLGGAVDGLDDDDVPLDRLPTPPPEDEVGQDGGVVAVNASRATVQNGRDDGSPRPISSETRTEVLRTGGASGSARNTAMPTLSRDSELHGAESLPDAKRGFLGRSPFWTCGANPNGHIVLRGSQPAGSRAPPGSSGVLGTVGESSEVSAGADLAAQLRSTFGGALDFLAGASLGSLAESDPPEEELTGIAMGTREQRLQWRDFLNEAVSSSCATSLFVAFDVEAEPPTYMRPPASAPLSDHGSGGGLRPSPVAPVGAGWLPLQTVAIGSGKADSDTHRALDCGAGVAGGSGPAAAVVGMIAVVADAVTAVGGGQIASVSAAVAKGMPGASGNAGAAHADEASGGASAAVKSVSPRAPASLPGEARGDAAASPPASAGEDSQRPAPAG